MSSPIQQVCGVIERRRDELVDLIKQLVRFKTVNPPAGNEKPAQDFIGEKLRKLGFKVDLFDVFPGRPNVVGVLKGSGKGKSVILNGHIDVAEARSSDNWKYDPFNPVLRDGRIYGRGTTDMKSSLAGFIMALDSILEAGYELEGDVIYESVIGEESGEPGTRRCIEKGYKADFAIVGEASEGRRILGSIGAVNACLEIKSPYTRHLGARARCIHAGGQTEGANCIEKMALRMIPALNDLERHWAVFKTHPLMVPGLALINSFYIEGGGNFAFMPDECKLYFTVRWYPNDVEEQVKIEVEDQIRRAAESDLWLKKYPPHIEWRPEAYPSYYLPHDFDPDHPGMKMLAQAYNAVTGLNLDVGGRGIITDAGWLHKAGIPTVIYGAGKMYQAHQIDEHVVLDDVLTFTKTVAAFLLGWCGLKKS